MRKAIRGSIEEARMLTLEQTCTYVGFGRTTCRKWCGEIGALRKFGNMVRVDKTVVDRALDQMETVKG